jgi:hypothetical protein
VQGGDAPRSRFIPAAQFSAEDHRPGTIGEEPGLCKRRGEGKRLGEREKSVGGGWL